MSDIFSPMADVLLSEDSETEIEEFKEIKEKINLQNKNREKTAFETAFNESKNKFSHNIKSPLRNIKILHDRFKEGLDEDEKELFKSIIGEVSGLTENLEIENPYNKTEAVKSKKAIYDVSQVFEKSVKRKLLEWEPIEGSPEVEIKSDLSSMPVFLNLSELRSIVSNLLNNSKDAGAKRIVLKLKRNDKNVEILISDDGRGVAKNLVQNIFDKDFTHGKDDGTGFGLYHAKKYLNQWSGDISLETSKIGASFKIMLPLWAYEKIKVSETDKVVILEDNPFFRKQVKAKLLSVGVEKDNIKIFFKSSDFQAWFDSQPNRDEFLLLADNDLGKDEKTGLELVKSLRDARTNIRAYLVTDGHENSELVHKAISSQVNIIPKSKLNHSILMRGEVLGGLVTQR